MATVQGGRKPLVDLSVCASVCCVSDVTQFSHTANKEASLCFSAALVCTSVHVDLAPMWESMIKLVDGS